MAYHITQVDTDRCHVYDVGTLTWVPMQQPILNAGSVTVTGTINQGTAGSSPWRTRSDNALTASSPTVVSVGASSAQAVATNSSRRGLVLINRSVNNISFGIGATAVLGSGITLPPNGAWYMDEFSFTTAAINAIASAGSSSLSVQEFS